MKPKFFDALFTTPFPDKNAEFATTQHFIALTSVRYFLRRLDLTDVRCLYVTACRDFSCICDGMFRQEVHTFYAKPSHQQLYKILSTTRSLVTKTPVKL